MVLDKTIFELDLEAEKHKRVGLIRATNDELQANGVLVAHSGGLDSAACINLSLEAVGADNVTALFMPNEGVTDDETYSCVEDVVQATGIHFVRNDSLKSI